MFDVYFFGVLPLCFFCAVISGFEEKTPIFALQKSPYFEIDQQLAMPSSEPKSEQHSLVYGYLFVSAFDEGARAWFSIDVVLGGSGSYPLFFLKSIDLRRISTFCWVRYKFVVQV